MNVDKIRKLKKGININTVEWERTSELTVRVQENFRKYKHLSIQAYHEILKWKIGENSSKYKKVISFSPDELVVSITKCYNEIEHPDDEMNTRIKMYILLGIPWIGISVASTIMSLHHPDLYAFVDNNSWYALYGKEKKTLAVKDYMTYLKDISELAANLGCSIQEVSYALSIEQQ